MAYTGAGHPNAEFNYSAGVTLQAELSKPFGQFEGSEPTNLIVTEERQGTGRGDEIEIRFVTMDRTALPLTDGEVLIGNELDSTQYGHRIKLDYYQQGVALENVRVEQDMLSYDIRKPKLFELGEIWAQWFEKIRIYHAVGHATTAINAELKYRASAANPVVAYNSENIYYVQGANTNTTDAQVAADTAAILTTDVIDDLMAEVVDPSIDRWPIVPCNTPFGDLYVLAVHPQGLKQIRSSNADNEFRPIVHSTLQGGSDYADSPFAQGGGFIYNNVLVVGVPWMPKGLTAGADQANTRAAVLGGARLLTQIFGEHSAEGDHLGYEEHRVLRRLTMQADTVCGINRTIVNGKTWGGIRVVHYSAR